MADFSFKVSPEIILGLDTLNRLPLIVNPLGNRTMIIADPELYSSKLIERVQGILETNGVKTLIFDEIPEFATSSVCEEAANLARGSKPHSIIALGGVQCQSIAKAAATLVQSKVDIDALIDGAESNAECISVIAIPTSLKDPFLLKDICLITDARTKNATLMKTGKGITKAVIMDPSLTSKISAKACALSCLEIMMQSTEGYVSTKASFFSDTILEKSFAYLFQAIDSLIKNPDDAGARVLMAHGSFLSALGTSASSLGLGSALSFALSAKLKIPKASIASILLPYIIETSSKARVEKIAQIALWAGENTEGISPQEASSHAAEAIRQRLGALKVPTRLKDFELDLDQLVEVATIAKKFDMINYLPRIVSVDDIYDILKQAF